MSENVDENKRFDDLSKKLEDEMTKVPKKTAEAFDSNVKRMKAEAIEQMDKAMRQGNVPAALFYQTQVRMCKLMLREYFWYQRSACSLSP